MVKVFNVVEFPFKPTAFRRRRIKAYCRAISRTRFIKPPGSTQQVGADCMIGKKIDKRARCEQFDLPQS